MIARLDRLIARREARLETRRDDRARLVAEIDSTGQLIEELRARHAAMQAKATDLHRWIAADRPPDGATLAGAIEDDRADRRVRLAAIAQGIDRTCAARDGAEAHRAALDGEIRNLSLSLEKLTLHRKRTARALRRQAGIREDAAMSELGILRR